STGGTEMSETVSTSDNPVALTVTLNGCTGTSQPVTVEERANPVPVIIGELSYCSNDGGTVLSSDQQYDSYSWSTGGTEMSETVSASNNPVALTVTLNGCTGTSEVVSAIEEVCTDLENAVSNESFVLYPNPVQNGTLFFSQELTNIEVFNSNGTRVASLEEGESIDVSQYANGLYIVKSEQGTKTFIVE
ncbi:MAG: T9SS type A sorting domain-containing protein, partial [Cytophagales bacterium]|nr:T9SS type A sorting domain-containing protein [Cytophagales bacterium]